MQHEMKYFNCLVKLGGDPVLMQAPRLHISEDEVRVLRKLHGDDAISHLTADGAQLVDRATHLYQLARYYNDPKMVEDLFRVSLDNFDAWLAEAIENEEEAREHRFQLAQFQKQNSSAPTISEAVQLVSAPGAPASRGVDPNAGNTTGIAAAAESFSTKVAAAVAEGATAQGKTKATIGKAPDPAAGKSPATASVD